MIKRMFPFLVYVFIFLILLPWALKINYWQNDEWVYYPNVEHLLQGDFKLNSLTAPTFYSAGLLAAFFSKIFGINNLPILTLLVSVMCSYFVYLILFKNLKINYIDSFLISMIVLINPIFVFTTWGFMTDNYFLFFFLIAIYFLSKEDILKEKLSNYGILYLIVGNIFCIIAYFTRQLGLIIPAALVTWLLINKRPKRALLQFLVFILLSIYHFYFFPKSSESLETKFQLNNLMYFRYLFSISFVILCYLALFTLPLLLSKIFSINLKDKKIWILITATILGYLFSIFYYNNIGWLGESIFYLKYTVNRRGFFVENLHGTKNDFLNSAFIYYLADILSKIVGISTLFYLVIYKKYKALFNFYTIIFCLYSVSLFITVKIYDRYLIPLFSLFIFSIVKIYLEDKPFKNYSRFLFVVFIGILGFYSYNFSADYILTNNYVWSKSLKLSEGNIDKSSIIATDAWGYMYPRSSIIYKFTYDNPSMQDYSLNWEQIDRYTPEYPLSFLKNTIYLYKKKN